MKYVEVLNNVLITEISKYCKLIKKNNLYWTKCPFHKENTASFCINEEKAFYYCFGCGESGNVIKFIQKINNLTYNQSLQQLSEVYNIKIKHTDISDIQTVMQDLCSYYQNNLSEDILKYFTNRNISTEMIQLFKLGYAIDGVSYLQKKGYAMNIINKTGISSYNSQDRFRDRLIFPILNRRSEIVGFAGRVLSNQEPKYLNSIESDLFHKSYCIYNEWQLVYGLPVIIVEGYIDVIKLTQYGFKNIVASMGTALTYTQLMLILQYTKKIYIMFDGDDAGKNAIKKNINSILEALQSHIEIFICNIQEKDPDDILNQYGEKKIYEYLNLSISLIDWIKQEYTKNLYSSPHSETQYIQTIDQLLQSINSPILRNSYRKYLIVPVSLNNTPQRKWHEKNNKETLELKILLFCIYFNLLEDHFELICNLSFSDKYEDIRLYLISNVYKSNILQEVRYKYDFLNVALSEYREIIYLNKNASQYLMDLINSYQNIKKIQILIPKL